MVVAAAVAAFLVEVAVIEDVWIFRVHVDDGVDALAVADDRPTTKIPTTS